MTRIKTARGLLDRNLVKAREFDDLRRVEDRYAIGITDHIHENIASPPVARQYIPHPDELKDTPEELNDPIGDEAYSPVPGIVHRYPDRVLFKVTPFCAVYCRYCFRREMVGPGIKTLSTEAYKNAYTYIRDHPEIYEVILTGGDPLILSPRQLRYTVSELDKINTVKIIRIHTRVPAADPQRVSDELCKSLKTHKTLYIALHINHPDELTPAVKDAVHKLDQSGAVLLSQSVLLRGVNDCPQTLARLMKDFVVLGIKPYYIHHPDLARGTSHFRLSLEEGRAIIRQLHGKISGLCQPSYMLDIPGGFGKIPVNSDYIERVDHGTYHVRDYSSRIHVYKDSLPP